MPGPAENAIKVIWVLLTRIVAFVLGAYVLYRVRSIMVSLLIAILLTYALLPFVEMLCNRSKSRRRIKAERLIATTVVFAILLLMIVTAVSFLVSPITSELSRLNENVQAYGKQLTTISKSIGHWYNRLPEDQKKFFEGLDYSGISKSITEHATAIIDATQSKLSVIMELVLIPVMAFYFVLDYRSLTREFYGLVPKRRRREALRIGREAGQILQSYVVGQVILCLIAGVVTGIVLWAFQMPYVMVLAVFAAITRAIPAIGPVVSGIPIVLVGLLNSGPGTALWLLVFVTVMHFAESKFIMPKLIGDRLHLHPAVVIIVLLVGAEFFGLVGMFLAAPVASIARELIRLYYIGPRDMAIDTQISDGSSLTPV